MKNQENTSRKENSVLTTINYGLAIFFGGPFYIAYKFVEWASKTSDDLESRNLRLNPIRVINENPFNNRGNNH